MQEILKALKKASELICMECNQKYYRGKGCWGDCETYLYFKNIIKKTTKKVEELSV